MSFMNRCPECGGYKEARYIRCYSCHMTKRQNIGFIRSLFLFLYLPSIPTLFLVAFGKAISEMGMPKELLFIFWLGATIILALINWQEVENIKEQFEKENWW